MLDVNLTLIVSPCRKLWTLKIHHVVKVVSYQQILIQNFESIMTKFYYVHAGMQNIPYL